MHSRGRDILRQLLSLLAAAVLAAPAAAAPCAFGECRAAGHPPGYCADDCGPAVHAPGTAAHTAAPAADDCPADPAGGSCPCPPGCPGPCGTAKAPCAPVASAAAIGRPPVREHSVDHGRRVPSSASPDDIFHPPRR